MQELLVLLLLFLVLVTLRPDLESTMQAKKLLIEIVPSILECFKILYEEFHCSPELGQSWKN